MKAHKRTFGWLAIVAALALVAAGCGSSDNSTSNSSNTMTTATTPTATTTETMAPAPAATDAAAGGALVLKVDPGKLKFDKETLTAPAGKVTISLTNTENVQHNVALKDASGAVLKEGALVGDAGVSTITLDNLKPGTYEYYCTPHESIGMKGTLTVT
ncbi:MAG: cupredoxin domain-containing protein [Thermoleophilia bacterium]|nr:cupredoxin domain-containing protein [Thermoleophilia bacterium]